MATYKIFHYILIQMLVENILIIEDCEDNKQLLNDIQNSYFNDNLHTYNIGTTTSIYDNLISIHKELVDDMINDKVNKMNFKIRTFENNSELDAYINEVENKYKELALNAINSKKIEVE